MRNGFDTLLSVVQNDFGYDLSFTLQDSAGVVLDISSSTLEFICQLESNANVQFTGSMVIVNASSGQCKYTVRVTDFVASGLWNAQIRVTYTTGEVLSFTGIQVQADPALPIG